MIQPGKPNKKTYVESFNDRPYDEGSHEQWVPTVLHVLTELERWRREYNEARTKQAIGGTP
ncbi:hypothetical protein XpiCFBP4643_07690 [Xanthomonas pisi]|uniref:Integrase catalytic domain-containing protein n=1 Tax=Xanthomonas pisi TaxID=56457 RepID=A0A2S7D4W0_9XANT|nr:hypothetical protein XpiCFBP4643_07690 [Xanthomonas pisi]